MYGCYVTNIEMNQIIKYKYKKEKRKYILLSSCFFVNIESQFHQGSIARPVWRISSISRYFMYDFFKLNSIVCTSKAIAIHDIT